MTTEEVCTVPGTVDAQYLGVPQNHDHNSQHPGCHSSIPVPKPPECVLQPHVSPSAPLRASLCLHDKVTTL